MRYSHIEVIQDEINDIIQTVPWPQQINILEDKIKPSANQSLQWPQHINVEGLTFDHFGSKRNADWAEEWLQRWRSLPESGPGFNPQPYEEMANYFKRVGAQDDSDQIRTAARNLELAAYRQQCFSEWDGGTCGHFMRVGFLKLLVGYGIGYGLFWVLLPTLLFVLIGWLVLQFSEKARIKGPLWCGIASLNKLIPGINFSKEYADAFDKPKILALNKAQIIYFFVHVVVGVVLASVIVAAVAGLTQAR